LELPFHFFEFSLGIVLSNLCFGVLLVVITYWLFNLKNTQDGIFTSNHYFIVNTVMVIFFVFMDACKCYI
jgi:hypothetical protein